MPATLDIPQSSPPRRRVFLSAEWKHLAALNWRVDPALLKAFVPGGTELDEFHGASFISVVAFQFHRARLLGVAIPFHVNFPEINLRFYVRRRAPDGWRRGVVFIKEIVPRAAIALVANNFYGERYETLPMSEKIESFSADRGPATRAAYAWKRGGKWSRIAAVGRGELIDMKPGSEAEFIFEHYWGYTARPNNSAVEYEVNHPRWRVWSDATWRLEADFMSLYGPEFATTLAGPPCSFYFAEGSPVKVLFPKMLGAG